MSRWLDDAESHVAKMEADYAAGTKEFYKNRGNHKARDAITQLKALVARCEKFVVAE